MENVAPTLSVFFWAGGRAGGRAGGSAGERREDGDLAVAVTSC